jgi:hypothetical protein
MQLSRFSTVCVCLGIRGSRAESSTASHSLHCNSPGDTSRTRELSGRGNHTPNKQASMATSSSFSRLANHSNHFWVVDSSLVNISLFQHLKIGARAPQFLRVPRFPSLRHSF